MYNSGNLNPYIYCYQSPVLYVDPNGKQTVFYSSPSSKDGKRYFTEINSYDNPNPNLRVMQYVAIFNNKGKFVEWIVGDDAKYRAIQKYGKHEDIPNVKPISAWAATKYVVKKGLTSPETQPIIAAYAFAPLDALIYAGEASSIYNATKNSKYVLRSFEDLAANPTSIWGKQQMK